MSSISQHISTDFFGRTSIIYGVTNIVFSLKQHIAPSSAPCLTRKYHYSSTGVMANRNMLYIIPTRRKMYRSSVFTESWRSCPTAFLLRSGEFIPRHPVHIHFSRCARGAICPLIPYLAIFRVLTENIFIKIFEVFSKQLVYDS